MTFHLHAAGAFSDACGDCIGRKAKAGSGSKRSHADTTACLQNLALVEKVRSLAAAKGCTPGQLALAWVHAQGEDVFPIPGTKRIKYLEENVAAAHIKLTAEDKQALESIFDAKDVSVHPSPPFQDAV